MNPIWHPYTSLAAADPLHVDSAKGIYLHTEDGRKIIDGISSWWVNLHGHGNETLARAVYEQAKKLEHVIFAGFTHSPARDLAERLLAILPGSQSKIFYSDNGSTAVEVAIKMALQYWYNLGKPRRKIIAIEGAYHGDTFGAMSVGERGLFTVPFRDHLFETVFIPFPTKDNIESTLDKIAASNLTDAAAFIYEPLVQGAAGMRIYPASILDKLLEFLTKHDILLIADEVFTGFGRTGKTFASEYADQKPDIIALSKGITGGMMPFGVTACNNTVAKAFMSAETAKTLFHGHSYTGNPLACAAALASLDLLLSNDCQNRIREISRQHEVFANRMKGNSKVSKAKCQGTILALELKTTQPTSYTNELGKTIYSYFLSRDILLRPLGNVLYVVPPYIITNEELNQIYREIELFLDEVNF